MLGFNATAGLPQINCQTDTCRSAVTFVIPLLTIILSTIVFYSPMNGILKVSEKKTLGSLNPLPYPWLTSVAFAWVAYGFLVRDYTIFFSNVFGIFLGLFYTFRTFPYATPKQQNTMMISLMFGVFLVISAGFLSFILFVPPKTLLVHDQFFTTTQQLPLGVAANILLIAFYSSPLTTLYKVLKSRNSRSFYFPLALASLTARMSWCVMGVILQDWFIVGPNVVTTLFALIQVLCCVIFPKRKLDENDSGSVKQMDIA